jgi:hypothetical protein
MIRQVAPTLRTICGDSRRFAPLVIAPRRIIHAEGQTMFNQVAIGLLVTALVLGIVSSLPAPRPFANLNHALAGK